MENKKKKSLIYPTLFMIVLASIMTFLLAIVNQQTKPLVAMNQELELKTKILNIFNIETDGKSDAIHSEFDKLIKDSGEKFNDEPIYTYEDNGEVKGYAVSLKGPGVWGPISAYIGLNKDYSEVLGIEFIEQAETPGLGARIEEDFYKEQYRNITSADVRGNIDAISGATGTSNAVINLVTNDLDRFLDEKGGSN